MQKPVLNHKESNYIDVYMIDGDTPQDGTWEGVIPTYTLVNWMRARNIQAESKSCHDISPEGGCLDFDRVIELRKGNRITLKSYVDTLLARRRLDRKVPENRNS